MGFIQRRILSGVMHVVEWPKVTLAIAAAVLAACALLAMAFLNISADQNRLFSPKVKFFADYLAFDEKFPENEAIYVVVESIGPDHTPAPARWGAVADSIAQKVAALGDKVVRSVDARAPAEQMGRQGLLLDRFDRLPQRVADVKEFVPLLRIVGEKPTLITQILGPTPIDRLLSVQNAGPGDAGQAEFVEALAKSLQQALSDPAAPLVPGKGLPDFASIGVKTPEDLGYYYVPDASDPTGARRLLLVRVYPNRQYNSLTAISDVVEQIRKAVRVGAEPFEDFKVGVTGRPALEADEMRTSDGDSHRAEIVALCFVFVGLWFMLRSIWLALVAEIGLAFGIGWTFGWATGTVGELNLLSIVFLIALIGIGMDYLVQILVRYRQEASRHVRADAIFCRVFRHVGPPINTACLGAAGAFLVAALTDFRGAAELGIIAGGGLVLCLIAGYTVVPAILTLFPARVRPMAESVVAPLLSRPAPAGGVRLLSPVVWLAIIAAGVPWAMKTEFDPNLLNLQAPHLESVKLLRKLQTWSAVVLSKDLNLLREVRASVKMLPSVAGTESALGAYDNADWLHEHSNLPTINWTQPTPVKGADLQRLARKALTLAEKFEASKEKKPAPDQAALGSAAQVLRAVSNLLEKPAIGEAPAVDRLNGWQNGFIEQLQALLAQFDPGPPRFEELPETVRSHFVSSDGTFALYINPKHDLWNRKYLEQFVKEVETAVSHVRGSPDVTGIASNVYHTTGSIQRAFYQSTIYALILIFILVLIDLRNIRNTLLAISVLALGLPMLVAIMGVLDVDWNFANFFGLPILIGAGHEYGVFMVHRYLEAKRDPRRAWTRWDASDKALLLCAYVTCSSFGFFWFMARHRGLKSLGLVMTLGTACIYLATVFAVRPVLLWRLKRRRERVILAGGAPGFIPTMKGPGDECPPG